MNYSYNNLAFFNDQIDNYGFYDDYERLQKHKKKHEKRRKRDIAYKKHLKFLAENVPGYPSPVIYVDSIYIEGYRQKLPISKPYYKRLYRGNHTPSRSKYYKKYANHIVRKYKGDIHNGSQYKKIYDYWWELY
jgi:hypothetical protein